MKARREPGLPIDVREERSLGELMGDLTRDMTTLVRKELELARIEVKEEARKSSRAGALFGATALTAYLSILLLSFAAAWALAEVMPEGLAFLLVGLAHAAASALLFVRGREELQKIRPVPEQTVETLKEDVEWARQQIK